MKKTKKFFALLLIFVLTLSTVITVYAHTWPDNPGDWTTDDWNAWNDYWWQAWGNWDNWDNWDKWKNWEEEKDGCYYDPYYDPWYNPWEDPWNKPWEDPWNKPWEDPCNKHNNQNNNYYNYSSYNYYGGILDVYDASTEDQAATLARIIWIYAHGVASQSAQAAVGWAVMNSVDASGKGANVCTVAGNFNYDYGTNVVDNYGRSLLPLARDILFRWKAGRAGVSSNGRVLPSGYYYVTSTGTMVTFGSTPNETRAVQSFGYANPYGS